MNRFALIKKACNGLTAGSPEDLLKQAYNLFLIHGGSGSMDHLKGLLDDYLFSIVAKNGHYTFKVIPPPADPNSPSSPGVRAARAIARKKGEEFYWTGQPCKHGHIAKRITRNAHCTECKGRVVDHVMRQDGDSVLARR